MISGPPGWSLRYLVTSYTFAPPVRKQEIGIVFELNVRMIEQPIRRNYHRTVAVISNQQPAVTLRVVLQIKQKVEKRHGVSCNCIDGIVPTANSNCNRTQLPELPSHFLLETSPSQLPPRRIPCRSSSNRSRDNTRPCVFQATVANCDELFDEKSQEKTHPSSFRSSDVLFSKIKSESTGSRGRWFEYRSLCCWHN